jgi:hypothetical protein
VTKSNSVDSDTELWSPLLRDRLRQANDTSLRERIVRLPSIAVRATRAANIHNRSWLTVLHTEIWCSSSNQSEGRGVVDRKDRVPLLVGDLVDYAIPGIAGVVDDVVDLPAAELGRLLDQDVNVVCIGHVSGYGDCAVRGVGVDLLCDGRGLCAVDVADNDFAAFIGEQAGGFRADALTRSGDAGRITALVSVPHASNSVTLRGVFLT